MPATIYKDRDGQRVPGVTTVLNQLGWSKGPLMYWAFNQGKSGVESLYEERDKAAEAGTIAHEMVQAYIRQEDPGLIPGRYTDTSTEVIAKAETAFDAFLDWTKASRMELLEAELSLVSEGGFGGTIDAIGMINGELSLVDWKTSNGVYPDQFVQVVAYHHLVHEHGFNVGPIHLIRFGKEDASFHHHCWPNVPDEPWEVFQHALALYHLEKKLRKMI